MDNIYTVRCGSLQMVSESIPTLVWGFVWPYRRCLTIWPHNPVGHNKDFVSTLGERVCDIPHRIRGNVFGTI